MSYPVTHNERDHRFEMHTPGGLAIVAYQRRGDDTLVMHHTEVPPSEQGNGLAARLVQGALDETRRLGLKVRPSCSYVRAFIARNQGYADLVETNASSKTPLPIATDDAPGG